MRLHYRWERDNNLCQTIGGLSYLFIEHEYDTVASEDYLKAELKEMAEDDKATTYHAIGFEVVED